MEYRKLSIYNTLTRSKEIFKSIHSDSVGLYVCGPTVYSNVHLGNCRTFVSFDLMFRYLLHLGYKVRYVRNITDAGHLEGDRDEGDDKFAKKAKLEQLEPMEIVQKYTLGFHHVLELFNTLPPSIEPTATGHICEQIEMIKVIVDNGYAYEKDGSVYFDVEKYTKKYNYGELTNRKLEDLLVNTRELGGQNEKKGRLDFALWIHAKPEHIMRWPSPWGWGFPGWHIECSAMSKKYLGEQFDIHGGGMDLQATHHTNEIAQSIACHGTGPARYWVHSNMLTVNGTRMSKSAGNGFLPLELFSGNHPLLERAYTPMSVRFFMMQTHYRSTLDFSNEALKASEKGYRRLMNAVSLLDNLKISSHTDFDISVSIERCYAAMNDDFNSSILIAELFEWVRIINTINDGKASIDETNFKLLNTSMKSFVFDVLGLLQESDNSETLNRVMNFVIDMRKKAKSEKNYATADYIRDALQDIGIQIKDGKDDVTWNLV